MREGEDPLDLREGHFYGVSVDAGMGCFLDADERERYAAVFDDDLPAELELGGGDFAMLDDGGLIAYHSGWGDGAYPTWIGRDENGAVVCFVTDMLLKAPERCTSVVHYRSILMHGSPRIGLVARVGRHAPYAVRGRADMTMSVHVIVADQPRVIGWRSRPG